MIFLLLVCIGTLYVVLHFVKIQRKKNNTTLVRNICKFRNVTKNHKLYFKGEKFYSDRVGNWISLEIQ